MNYIVNDIDGNVVQQVTSGTAEQIAAEYPAGHPVLDILAEAVLSGDATGSYEIDGQDYTTRIVAAA